MGFREYVMLQWDRVAAWVAIALGLLVLLLGWIGVSGTPFPAEQLPYLVSGGLLGLFLLGVAGVLYLSADLRDEWRKLDDLERLVRESLRRDSGQPGLWEEMAPETALTPDPREDLLPQRQPARRRGKNGPAPSVGSSL